MIDCWRVVGRPFAEGQEGRGNYKGTFVHEKPRHVRMKNRDTV